MLVLVPPTAVPLWCVSAQAPWTLPRTGARSRGSHGLTDAAPTTADFSPAQHLIVVLHGAPSFLFDLFVDERAGVLAHSRIQFRNGVGLHLGLVDAPAKRAWGAEVELQ